MASSVQVLCLNGRRQNVKVTPNTKILQILEEVCLKQGYQPVEEYNIKHGRKILDPTVIYRYSGLPNNAKLELVKAEKKRKETNVTLALQLDTGDRFQAEFSPSTTIAEVLDQWKEHTSPRSGLQRVCIYMREEIIGDVALRETNLRKLGLVSGKGLVRLVHREVDDATLKNVEDKILKEKAKMAKMASKSGMETARLNSNESTTDTSNKDSKTFTNTCIQEEQREGTSHTEPMDTEDTHVTGSASEPVTTTGLAPAGRAASSVSASAACQKLSQDDDSRREADGGQEDVVQYSAPGSNENLPPHIRAQVQQLAATLMPGADSGVLQAMMSTLTGEASTSRGGPRIQQVQYVQPFAQGFKFPEETKGKPLYHNELSRVNKQEFKPCDRETVVYNMDEAKAKSVDSSLGEELPDSFFELTESELRRMMTDLKSKAEQDQVLMTAAMRHAQKEARMDKYPRVIIRVHFPERIMLQGVFNVRESVYALYKYVKEHLEDKTREFYLYTTPPKSVLKDRTSNLFEANLAPMCVVHFGCEVPAEVNLSLAVRSEVSTQEVADQVVMKYMSQTSPGSTSIASTSGECSSSGGSSVPYKRTSSSQASSSSSNSNTQSNSNEPSKVPKWFKTGKK